MASVRAPLLSSPTDCTEALVCMIKTCGGRNRVKRNFLTKVVRRTMSVYFYFNLGIRCISLLYFFYTQSVSVSGPFPAQIYMYLQLIFGIMFEKSHLPIMVRIMIHSKTIHRTNRIATLRNGFVPERMNSELGSSAIRSFPGIAVLRRPIAGIFEKLLSS